jgi:hypothetical protein
LRREDKGLRSIIGLLICYWLSPDCWRFNAESWDLKFKGVLKTLETLAPRTLET